MVKINDIKDKIIEKLKSDKDLLFSTLRNELINYNYFDHMIVFESIDKDTIQTLNERYSDFNILFEERKNEILFGDNKHCISLYFTFNPKTKEIIFYDNLYDALSNAINHLEKIASFITENYHPIFEWYEVINIIENENIDK